MFIRGSPLLYPRFWDRAARLTGSWEAGKVVKLKTTLDLPNDLVREMKLRAVHEGWKLKDLAAEMIRRGLAQPERPVRAIQHRVKLPLIQCRHPAAPTRELTPNTVAEVLLKQEMEWLREPARR